MAVLLYACGSLQKMQKVQSQVPILGSIGKHRSSLFKKSFQKVGEPQLNRPISVEFKSVPFSGKSKSRYEKYLENRGMQPLVSTMDSTQSANLIYYQLRISDFVHLVEEFNQEKNTNLKTYLQEDTELVLLSSISFVANKELSKKLDAAEKLYLATNTTGGLVLTIGEVRDGYTIQQSALEIFDYNTAPFCWNKDKRGQLNIAQILLDDSSCPGNTNVNPKKLDKTPDYLKP